MSMQYIFIVYLILMSIPAIAQDSILVQFSVIDKKYGDPVKNVDLLVIADGITERKRTNSQGKTFYTGIQNQKLTIKLTHPQFVSVEERITLVIRGGVDTLKIAYEMEFIRSQELAEIVVPAPGIPVAVYGSKHLHVEDFEVLRSGDLLLLTYPKRLKKGSELLYHDGISVLNSFSVPGEAKHLIRDFRGNTHVVCAENVFGIYPDGKTLGISSLPKEYFFKYIAPIVDTNQTRMYFTTFNPDFPAFEYFSFDQLDSTYRKIMKIEDDLMMELYRAEYKWVDVRTKLWAKNKEIQTGVDAEIWVGANYFTQSVYYKELYAPLFHRNDSLFVFDYYKDKLYTYNKFGDAIDSTAIYHHYDPKNTGWKSQLIQDKVTGEIYALFDREGYSYLGRVDTKSGEITEQVKLEYRYVTKIEVHNNNVFYVYRPFESIQKKFLYKERLPYEFSAASLPNGDQD